LIINPAGNVIGPDLHVTAISQALKFLLAMERQCLISHLK